MTRSTRTLIAIMLWLLAGFMGTNNIVMQSDLGGWLVPLILLIVGLILALYPEGEASLAEDAPQLTSGDHAVAHLPPATPSPTPAPALAATPSPTPPPAPPKPAASSASGPDDLTVVEGIGPKMQAALRAAGIDTYVKMTETSEDEFRAAIEAQGMRFAPSIPTWAEQAAFAAKGDWDGLSAFQSTLKAGRR